jgi:endonuclease-3 related protein
VCVGAILTQNTAWGNVERAISNLRRKGQLGARALHRLPRRTLARRLRPSGYFNVKAQRLQSLVRFFLDEFGGSIARLRRTPDLKLRRRLLGVNGIGRETADSILCYALEKPFFVVDAYTRRIFSRHGWIRGDEDYDAIRALVETSWRKQGRAGRTGAFNELHALLVAVGKDFCRPSRPDCARCPLGPRPPAALGVTTSSSNR